MPKKFGVNTKKEEAKEREATKKKEQKEKEIQRAEDAYWRETDEKVLKKKDKDEEKERKRLEALKRKQENKEQAEREMNEILESKNKGNVKGPTRADIQDHKERTIKKLLEQKKEEEKEVTEEIDIDKEFINPNYLNPIISKTESGADIIDVSGVDQALNELELNELDKHPEKRMRAAWKAYFEKQLPIVKAENPNAKRSQLIDIIQREFKKSPDNPVYRQQLLLAKQSGEI